jgi:SRSO17 transposase
MKELAGDLRFEAYLQRIGDVLGHDSRRQSYATYALGILGDCERKSIEPIAARACIDPAQADAAHQRLLHFALDSPWSDREVRRTAAHYALEAMTARSAVQTWIVDDTGFLKQGKHSVGVQRQYTGSAGKITNCQIGVSLTVATEDDQLPIDFALYLPKGWANNKEKRKEARIPPEVVFKTKPELAIDLIKNASADGIPKGVLLADAAYGSSAEWRQELRQLGFHYAVGVVPTTVVRPLERIGRYRTENVSLKTVAERLWKIGAFRRFTYAQGTNRDLSAYFLVTRVVPAHAGATPLEEREPLWLIVEWREDEDEPANYFLSSLPEEFTERELVTTVMQRWRTERAYEDLKGELGLDHYEGRRFPGWHHHVSVVLSCYAFVVAERVRRFPPSADWPRTAGSLGIAA